MAPNDVEKLPDHSVDDQDKINEELMANAKAVSDGANDNNLNVSDPNKGIEGVVGPARDAMAQAKAGAELENIKNSSKAEEIEASKRANQLLAQIDGSAVSTKPSNEGALAQGPEVSKDAVKLAQQTAAKEAGELADHLGTNLQENSNEAAA
jgi:hypothetical protein